MSRANIPPMSSTQSNPRLNTKMETLLSKIYGFSFLDQPLFVPHLINSLVDHYLRDKPRELFQLMMAIEYRWRLSLHVPMSEENEVMINSVKNHFQICHCPASNALGGHYHLQVGVFCLHDPGNPEDYKISRECPNANLVGSKEALKG